MERLLGRIASAENFGFGRASPDAVADKVLAGFVCFYGAFELWLAESEFRCGVRELFPFCGVRAAVSLVVERFCCVELGGIAIAVIVVNVSGAPACGIADVACAARF